MTSDGEFDRPSSVHVSGDGTVYVSDWRNDRVQVFDMDGAHRETLVGHATLSQWCQEFLDVNPEQASWRANSGMAEREKLFWRPAGIDTNSDGLVCISRQLSPSGPDLQPRQGTCVSLNRSWLARLV